MCLGIPGEVTDVHEEQGLRFGRVKFAGVTRDVCLEYQRDAGPGDFVLVHVGFAIAKIDREEAARAWEVLRSIGQTDEVEGDRGDIPEEPEEPGEPMAGGGAPG